MTEEEITRAMYTALDSYEYNLRFKPGLKTLIKISAAVTIGNVISLYAMKYTGKGLKKLAERVEWETIKKNYHKSEGEGSGIAGTS